MTPEQFATWKDFALRMARTCFEKRRRPDAKWIAESVEEFLDGLSEEDIFTIKDWDNSGRYEDQRREYYESYCNCEGRRKYNENDGRPLSDCPECHGCGVHKDFQHGPLICDEMSGWKDETIYYSLLDLCTDRELARRDRYREWWDHDRLGSFWQDMYDELERRIIDHWADPVACCVRAGLGAAVKGGSGMGVLGFTAGEIRKMYPEGVPDFVKNGEWESIGVAAVVPGIGFVPEPKGDWHSFDSIPDEQEIWL